MAVLASRFGRAQPEAGRWRAERELRPAACAAAAPEIEMTTRTTSKTVTFRHPFVLEGFPAPLPAGAYVVDTDEEELDSMLSQGWRRVSTTMRVRVGGEVEVWPIDPVALHEALTRDDAQNVPGLPRSQSAKVYRDRAQRNLL